MGQKTHPIGFRLGVTKTWLSRWFTAKGYANLLHEDIRIRHFLKEKLYHAGTSKIEIERKADQVRVIIHAARPGIIIGRKGAEVDKLREELNKMTGRQIQLDIVEVRRAELDAQLIAEQVALQLERRVAFRRVIKKVVQTAMRLGAQGAKIAVAGRLAGAEIARKEWYREGRVPLHTLRADIDYGMAVAKTTYGVIGVKGWVFHGEILPEKTQEAAGETATLPERPRRGRKAQRP